MVNHKVLSASALVLIAALGCAVFSVPALGLVEGLALSVSAASLMLAVIGCIFLHSGPPSSTAKKTSLLADAGYTDQAGFGASDEPKKKLDAEQLAFTDTLTGLGNLHRMVEKYNRLLEENMGEKGHGFLVGMVNLVGMKPINDLYGYEGGDEILKQCAQRLSAAVEESGFVFRTEGDEFGFLFPAIATYSSAEQMGKTLQDILSGPFDLNGRNVRIRGSFGFALCDRDTPDFEEIIKRIESALYYSRRNNKSRVTIYSDRIEQKLIGEAKMEQALRSAIETDSVRPHYQPIISLQNGELLGFEALARWRDPELGYVSPAEFIMLAEQQGFISQLTERLLQHAARAASAWPENLFLSFNLSSAELGDASTAGRVIETVKKAGLVPTRLQLEVTETAMMSDPETASLVIDELAEAGIGISMDDFGTGQSSLGRLRELHLDKVKIDRSFVTEIGKERPAEHIVKAIIGMCSGLELTVIAEGIEDIAQAERLKRFGCHAGQGYLFGKPQDAQRTMSYIREFYGARSQPASPELLAG